VKPYPIYLTQVIRNDNDKYEGGSKRFRPDIQKSRQTENAARDILVFSCSVQ